jgi:hypothetical protein
LTGREDLVELLHYRRCELASRSRAMEDSLKEFCKKFTKSTKWLHLLPEDRQKWEPDPESEKLYSTGNIVLPCFYGPFVKTNGDDCICEKIDHEQYLKCVKCGRLYASKKMSFVNNNPEDIDGNVPFKKPRLA